MSALSFLLGACAATPVVFFLGVWVQMNWETRRSKVLEAQIKREEAIREATEKCLKAARQSRERWRDEYVALAFDENSARDKVQELTKLLHGTEEALKFSQEVADDLLKTRGIYRCPDCGSTYFNADGAKALDEACAVEREEKKRLMRLFERMEFYNPDQHGKHECCPCVDGMQKEYRCAAQRKTA